MRGTSSGETPDVYTPHPVAKAPTGFTDGCYLCGLDVLVQLEAGPVGVKYLTKQN